MAYVKIKPINSVQHLKSAIEYSENENKTVCDTEHWLKNLDAYIVDDEKTNGGKLVTAFNCDDINTYEDFVTLKRQYGKMDALLTRLSNPTHRERLLPSLLIELVVSTHKRI